MRDIASSAPDSSMKSRLVVAVFAASFALAASATPADTLADRLGTLPVTLPTPAGFAPAEGAAATMRDIIARALPPNDRLIAVQVPRDYLARQRAHEATGSLSRYVTVLTYRNYEASGMSPALFDAVKKAMRGQGDEVMKTAQAQLGGAVDKMNKDLANVTGDSTAALKVGAISSLGLVDEQPNSFVMATIGAVAVSSRKINETNDQVAVVAVVLIHRKPINANFYSDYGSKDDLDWAENQAREWIRRVNELNP